MLFPYKHFKTFKRKRQKAIVSRVNHWKWSKICHEIRLNTEMVKKTYCLAILRNWNIITFRENNAYKPHGFCAGSIFHRKKRRKERGKEKKIYSKCEIYLLDIKETNVRGSLYCHDSKRHPSSAPWTILDVHSMLSQGGYLCSESTEWLSLTLTIFSTADAPWRFLSSELRDFVFFLWWSGYLNWK